MQLIKWEDNRYTTYADSSDIIFAKMLTVLAIAGQLHIAFTLVTTANGDGSFPIRG